MVRPFSLLLLLLLVVVVSGSEVVMEADGGYSGLRVLLKPDLQVRHCRLILQGLRVRRQLLCTFSALNKVCSHQKRLSDAWNTYDEIKHYVDLR